MTGRKRLRRRCLDSQARPVEMVEILRLRGPFALPRVCCAQDDRAFLVWLFLGEFAAMTAVENVDQEAKAEPDYEAQPCDDGQSGHKAAAEND